MRGRVVRMVGAGAWRRDLKSLHPLIAKILADDETRRRNDAGSPYQLRWTKPLFDSPFERRRLKLLNNQFLALAKTGARPWHEDDEAKKVGFVVGAERVSLALDHPDARPDRMGRHPTREGFTDVLRLAISGVDKFWSDTVEEALEMHLTEIAVEIIVAGEASLRAGAQAAYERACKHRVELEETLLKQRAEAVRQARERAIKAEDERRRGLRVMAVDHRKADQIRALIEDVVKVRGRDPTEADGVARRPARAGAVADRLDPIPRLGFDPDGHASLIQAEPPDPDR
jgi:hypothetical protein